MVILYTMFTKEITHPTINNSRENYIEYKEKSVYLFFLANFLYQQKACKNSPWDPPPLSARREKSLSN